MKHVALVGASMRIRAFVRALLVDYRDTHRICAVMDVDDGKMRAFNESLGLEAPRYTDFDAMCREARPDLLLISTVDATHCGYVVAALDRGIASICEKPLCVNAEQCREILAAQRCNPGVPAVTSHNARYHVAARTVKQLLEGGAIGRIHSVQYAEMLDLGHGASYFRRWNRQKALSGGLQIHKASHHFDKLNWWLGLRAQTVAALGGRRVYGPAASPFRGDRCATCPHRADCRFAIDYREPKYIDYDLFLKYGTATSYKPDGCVFSPEIDIEDFFTAGIEYEDGVCVSYSLAAHCNIEGETVVFEGARGRLEMVRRSRPTGEYSHVELHRFGSAEPERIAYAPESGTHGGADRHLFADLFGENRSGRLATLEDGIQAVLIGAAVNVSLSEGRRVDVQALL